MYSPMKCGTLMTLITIVWTLVLCSSTLFGAPDNLYSLEGLRFQHATRIELAGKPVKDLVSKYRLALEKLEKKYSDAGDLSAVLSVRKELERIGDLNDGGNIKETELRRMQGIYRKERGIREMEEGKMMLKLNADFLKQLVRLETELTKNRKIEEAVKVQEEAAKVRRTIAKAKSANGGGREEETNYEWSDPEDGRLGKGEGTLELTGSGKLGSQSVTILNIKLPDRCELTGRCRVIGSWAGFVFAADRSGQRFYTIFCREDGSGARVEYVENRQRLSKPEVDLPWEKRKWHTFSITRNKNSWSFKLSGKSVEFQAIDGNPGDFFGLLVFSPASIAVKDFKIVH